MSSTALSTKVLLAAGGLPAKHVVVPLPVYAASTPYIVPVISGHVTPIKEALIGLVPIFPVIADEGTSVIPAFVRITKFPAWNGRKFRDSDKSGNHGRSFICHHWKYWN